MSKLVHTYKDGKCECGCELRFTNIKGRGRVRIYSYDGFKTFVAYSPACPRVVVRISNADKMKTYRENNKEGLSRYFKDHYQKKKKEMFKKVLKPTD